MKNNLFILLLLFTSIFETLGEKCVCPTFSADSNKNLKEEFSTSTDDVIVGELNYGKQLKIGKLIVLQKSSRTRASTTNLKHYCPTGIIIIYKY